MNLKIDENFTKITKTPCKRCGGAGRFQSLTHVEGGVCFGCNGSGGFQGARLHPDVKAKLEAVEHQKAEAFVIKSLAEGSVLRSACGGFHRLATCGCPFKVELDTASEFAKKHGPSFTMVNPDEDCGCENANLSF
jgi:hypothetical protein